MDQTITISKHEVVVDREFIEKVGFLLADHATTDEEKELSLECITLGQIPWSEEDDNDEYEEGEE